MEICNLGAKQISLPVTMTVSVSVIVIVRSCSECVGHDIVGRELDKHLPRSMQPANM